MTLSSASIMRRLLLRLLSSCLLRAPVVVLAAARRLIIDVALEQLRDGASPPGSAGSRAAVLFCFCWPRRFAGRDHARPLKRETGQTKISAVPPHFLQNEDAMRQHTASLSPPLGTSEKVSQSGSRTSISFNIRANSFLPLRSQYLNFPKLVDTAREAPTARRPAPRRPTLKSGIVRRRGLVSRGASRNSQNVYMASKRL